MKTWIRRILVCVILGAITTIAVAWACAWWSEVGTWTRIQNGTETDGRDSWKTVTIHMPSGSMPVRFGSDRLEYLCDKTVPVRVVEQCKQHYQEDSIELELIGVCIDRRGWPMRAMSSTIWVRRIRYTMRDFLGDLRMSYPWASPFAIDHAIVIKDDLYAFYLDEEPGLVLPLKPQWVGFTIDTLFYALVWSTIWQVLCLPGMIRRWLRMRRGACVSCGYSLRGIESAQCPVCGTATNVERS